MKALVRCSVCETFLPAGVRCFSCGLGSSGAARVLGLALMSAGLAACQSMYGIAVVKPTLDSFDSGDTALRDRDEDGFASDVDCNDHDPQVFPGAPDTPGDGLDTNCDGFDDT